MKNKIYAMIVIYSNIITMDTYHDFILCYRKSHGINWDCEKGYKSVKEVNERSSELLSADKNLTTIFFPDNNYTPDAFKWMMMYHNLSPKIIIHTKSYPPQNPSVILSNYTPKLRNSYF